MPWRALECPRGTDEAVMPAVGEGRGGGAESREKEVGKRVDSVWKEEGQGGEEAKTLRRSIPSLRATRFRSPAAFMHQERGQRGGGWVGESKRRRRARERRRERERRRVSP